MILRNLYFVLLVIGFSLFFGANSAFADEYDDAAAKCPTYECQQAIMYQKMNAAITSGYDPMQESMEQSNKAIRDAYALLNQGNGSLDAGEYEQAIEYFARVLEISTDLEQKAAAHAGLGWSYYDLKDSELAAYHLSQARELSNEAATSTSVMYSLIDSYITLEEWENALDAMTGFEEDEEVKPWVSIVKEKIRTDNVVEETGITCGKGTVDVNGQCVVDTKYKSTSKTSSKGGGCLIATATYGSELAPQVQQLRELRDNSLLQTESGTNFMNTFNDFYYSFSPYIADYERENPIFKEMVKIVITPMISSLSILNYVDMDSESSVLGYGISLILLNGLMYVGIPASVIVVVRRF